MSTLVLAIFAGAAAGVVHVLSGPDHLAAVVPFAVAGRRGAVRAGALWGLGHGLGVAGLAGVAVLIRSSIDIEALSSGAEIVVGASLVLLGLWSIRRSRLMVVHTHPHRHGDETHAHPHVHIGDRRGADGHHPPEHGAHIHSVFGFGVVHGLAGTSHLLGVLPSLALESASAVAYLVAFLVGGVGAMTAFALAAGRLVRREAWRPRGLALAGVTSIGVGLFWLFSASLA